MNVSCPECRSVFRIDPAKVPSDGVDARCSVCGAVIAVAAARLQPAATDVRATVPRSEAPYAHDAPSPIAVQARHVPPTETTRESGSFEPDPHASEFRDADARASAAPVSEPVAATETRTRPVNPYLNNTPELRARRLARALVSDLVAYNPQKREEGLRDGTLRQLFREEIRKSWDEYVEQVGASVAESTPHFQDALNDVLAGGRRVF